MVVDVVNAFVCSVLLDVELELFACEPFDGEGGSILLFLLLLGDDDDDVFLLAIGLKILLKLPRLLCFLLDDDLLSSSDANE